jgi:hypothetical protein
MRAGIALAMAFVICGVAAGPGLADRHGHRHGRRSYERHDRGWYGPRHFFYSSAPTVYYAPPPVVYTPAYPAPPRIGFIFPLWH